MRPSAEKRDSSTQVGHHRDDYKKKQKSAWHAAMSLAIDERRDQKE